jgi:hypothetical protein
MYLWCENIQKGSVLSVGPVFYRTSLFWRMKDVNTLGAIQILCDTFLALFIPPVWHFSIFDDWFLGLKCFEILNELEIKYL